MIQRHSTSCGYIHVLEVGAKHVDFNTVVRQRDSDAEPEVRHIHHRLPRTSYFPVRELREGYCYFMSQVMLDYWHFLQTTELESGSVLVDVELMKSIAPKELSSVNQ